ncbi:class II aldolase/adducin family protein [Roseomonas sp. HJA6]|uniref:Class II aldolase/adducin family protein n=1 Tax=Roseomonas alba TaxID=2846776 RepID=A0ABS7A214_9PROT|nr:class II aldolase/adducin family protein [Neoroseomonas alba]MBW6396346.1 class II aldolase/adducin family protein [Neoroseomonas alba]
MSAEAIVAAAQRLDAAGMMPSKSGNLSVRDGEDVLITPAALPYAQMTPADIVSIDRDGIPAEGAPHRPSSEWRLHAAIYAARSEIGAVVHTHSPRATALSCARRGIPPFHYMVLLAGGPVRCAKHATFGTAALARECVTALADRRAVLLANHGVVAAGATLQAAVTLALEIENLAGQYLDLRAAGLKPVLLTKKELAEAAAQFAHYGR